MPNIDEAIEALLAYRQADMEGVMVLTSRQAIHEVAYELKRLREPARSSAGTEELWAAIRQRDANINTLFAKLKLEEDYLLGEFGPDYRITPSDIRNSFRRLREVLRTPTLAQPSQEQK